MIFQRAVVDVRVRDVAVRDLCDFMFGVMRRETTLDGALAVWFDDKGKKTVYSVQREMS